MSTTSRPYDGLKRVIDIVGAGVGLVVMSPIIAIVAIAVQLRLGGPVLFRQQRPGRHGRVFTMYKFRTMLDVDESRRLVTDEERMTRFGSWLRSTSLDELPSLWNVLKGEMTLVGPRPLMVDYLELYSSEQARRHDVRPGLTGLAQVSGRNGLSWEDKFALDVEYVDTRTLGLDLRILAQTVSTVLRREGIATNGHVAGALFKGSHRVQTATSEPGRT